MNPTTMKISVLGTGNVGATIGAKLVALGHDVKMGSRSATNEKALAWKERVKGGASVGTFADSAAHGEMIFNCTNGAGTLEALHAAGAANLKGKLLIDISNALDFSKGFPPTLAVCNTDSLGEQVQRAFPDAKVVKTLNTVNCDVMVDASRVHGEHTMFMAGNDADAKAQVRALLSDWFGWRDILDLGDISMARGTEMYLPLWVRMYGALKTAHFNIKVVR